MQTVSRVDLHKVFKLKLNVEPIMLNILFSPQWFYDKDILIDIVSVIVLGLISYVTLRYYQLTRKRQHMFFSLASALLSLSFIFKIITNFTLYHYVLKTQQIGSFTSTSLIIQNSDTLLLAGTLLYRLLTLLGFYLLFSIYYNQQPKPVYTLMIFFIFVATCFTSTNYYIFHLAVLLFLIFIVRKYYQNYIKTRDRPAKLIFISFGIIMLSQFVFLFINFTNVLYVLAEIIQLFGYSLLLTSFIMVLYYGKKKK